MQIKLEALVCVRTGAQGAKASVKLKGRARRIGTVKKNKKGGVERCNKWRSWTNQWLETGIERKRHFNLLASQTRTNCG